MQELPQILYCHCAYAQVVPREVKHRVLERLSAAGVEFEAVPDLCELSARRDPRLADYARQNGLRIAACFPRAVQGLFAAAGCPLSEKEATIVNLRTLQADEAADALLGPTGSTGNSNKEET
jgi:hypothetical protein